MHTEFITVFTTARHWPLSCAKRTQSTPLNTVFDIHFNIIMSESFLQSYLQECASISLVLRACYIPILMALHEEH
jgi:hypothetical protein